MPSTIESSAKWPEELPAGAVPARDKMPKRHERQQRKLWKMPKWPEELPVYDARVVLIQRLFLATGVEASSSLTRRLYRESEAREHELDTSNKK